MAHIKQMSKKKELSRIIKEQYKNGRVHPNLGKNLSDDTKKKISDSHKGLSAGGKNPRATPVELIETGEVFSCVKDASEKYGINRTLIADCCKQKRENAKGLHWKYRSQANTVPSSETEKV